MNNFRFASVKAFYCFSLFVLSMCAARAQNVGIGLSTVYDQNIFDINVPRLDRITRTDLSISKDWNGDVASFNVSYDGSLLLFRDLPSRNYHLHQALLNSLFQFTRDDPEEPDTSDTDSTDGTAGVPAPQPAPHADSLDQFLSAIAGGAAQVDHEEFSDFDYGKAIGALSFRQPVGLHASVTPSYRIVHTSYTNLGGLTNTDQLAAFQIGTDAIRDTWLSLAASYGSKSYPESSTTITLTRSGPGGSSGSHGHGKGGGGSSGNSGSSTTTRTVVFNVPSVHQVLFSGTVSRRWGGKNSVALTCLHLEEPSSAARILPGEINNVLEQSGLGESGAGSELYDDHYGYSGNTAKIEFHQTIPSAIGLSVVGEITGKTYVQSALGFDSTATTGGSRSDRRMEALIELSKSFPAGESASLKPHASVHIVRNESNTPFYDFAKFAVEVGIEYDF